MKHQIHVLIFYTIKLTVCLSPTIPTHKLETDLTIPEFILSLLHAKFATCTLVFLQQTGDQKEIDNSLAEMLAFVTSTGKLYYNFNPTLERTDGNSTFQKTDTYAPATNQKTNSCKVAIVGNGGLDNFKKLNERISPAFNPFLRKDVDHFIFIANVKNVDQLLLDKHLPSKIKYKIAVIDASAKGLPRRIVVKAVCFFCNEGKPQIVEHPAVFNLPSNPMEHEYFPDYLRNMMGTKLRISCPAVQSRIEIRKPWTTEAVNNAKRGAWKDLLQAYLMIKFNFTFNMFVSSGQNGKAGGGTGQQLPNGEWIGVVGDLVNGKAEVGICTAPTAQRLRTVSFTNSFFEPVFLTFVTPRGERVFSPKILLWPFHRNMWFAILASTIFAFIMFGLLKWAIGCLHLDSEDNLSYTRRGKYCKEAWGLEHQIFFVTTAYLEQDCVMPKFAPLRCFVALWLFYVLIISTIYRAKMVGLMANPVIERVPSTFEALSKSNYKVGFMKHGDAAYNTLKGSKDPIYVKLMNNIDVINGIGLECMERVVSGRKYACIGYNVSLSYLNARNFSDVDSWKLIFAPDSTFVVYLGLALEGGSIYKEGFDKWLGWVRPFHLQQVWDSKDLSDDVRNPTKEWWKNTNQTQNLQRVLSQEFSDLSLKHVSGLFYVMGFGVMGGILVFIWELGLNLNYWIRFWRQLC